MRSTAARALTARGLARLQLILGRFPDEAHYIRAVFRAVLDREPDPAALAHYKGALAQGRATRADVYNDVLASEERRRRLLDEESERASPRWLDGVLWLRIRGEEARLARAHPGLPADERFLRAAYMVLLRRPPDDEARRYLSGELARGAMDRARAFRTLRASPEFVEQQGLRLHPDLRARLYGAVAARYLRAAGRRAWPLDPERFLQAAYGALLGREVDAAGAQMFLGPLGRGALSPVQVLDSICDSSEFKQRFDLPIRPLDALHQARMLLIQTRLPPAEEVVDLGGAAHNEPRGALLMMGYPYRPRSITILDLPPDDRIGGAAAAERLQHLVTDEGTTVRYLYRSMADLDPIPDASVDMVVSGESIEHISEADAEHVCDEAWRILRPGGSFCLDTPNALLTRLQLPDQLIHPEHQKEYRPDEIREMLERRGFAIADAAAICPMPECLASGVFDFAEMTRNIGLSDNPDEGYMFYFRAVKP
ncbi:MAG TPA: DUF4214 domain-containing protein [Chloroflexaceae bacterium]|nr:DUF4214 domain-containing protein [Chloroflexaceae bacterium]